jgi:hypothetical protein
MSARLRQLIKNQPQVKVAQHVQDDSINNVWVATLAFIFAGVFYFYGYYFFGETVWRVLVGD